MNEHSFLGMLQQPGEGRPWQVGARFTPMAGVTAVMDLVSGHIVIAQSAWPHPGEPKGARSS